MPSSLSYLIADFIDTASSVMKILGYFSITVKKDRIMERYVYLVSSTVKNMQKGTIFCEWLVPTINPSLYYWPEVCRSLIILNVVSIHTG